MKLKVIIKVIVGIIAIGFIVLQFFQIDKKNPAIVQAETLEAAVSVPADVSMILGRSCGDCHTNTTVYPWYANVQPFGWFLKSHIDEGRQKLNLSVFKTYAANRQAKKLENICDQVEKKEMPLPSYLWIHRDAALKEGDAKVLCDWAKSEADKLD